MPVILSAPGTVEPLANVAVKPRVDGQIVEVAFKEGDLVEEGSVLFRLDDRIAKAQIAQAEASIAKDEASLRDAEATLARRQALIDKKVVTRGRARSGALCRRGPQGQHRRRTGSARIAEDAARLPHHPRADHRPHRQPDAPSSAPRCAARTAACARHHQPDQADPGHLLAAAGRPAGAAARAHGQGERRRSEFPAAREPVRGTIAFIDNQVDKQTGTIVAKVVAENADEVLWPGQSVEVALTVEVKPSMLSVPAAAVLPAQQGMIAWVIGARQQGHAARGDGGAHRRPDGVPVERRRL